MDKFKSSAIMVVLTLGVYALTKNPLTAPFKLHLLLLVLLGFAYYWYYLSRRKVSIFASSGFVCLFIVLALLLVGATGWFFSPFFFTLYLLGIMLALMYAPLTSFAFTATLVILFSFNIGEVDLAYDFLVILSLLSTIPAGLFLRREYLHLKEGAKEILVLKHEHEKYKNELEEVLANTMNSFAVSLRQPLSDIKQLSYRLAKVEGKPEEKKDQQRIIASVEEALRLLKSFEEDATGKKLLSTPIKSEPILSGNKSGNKSPFIRRLD